MLPYLVWGCILTHTHIHTLSCKCGGVALWLITGSLWLIKLKGGPRTYDERLEKFLVEYTLSHTHTHTHTLSCKCGGVALWLITGSLWQIKLRGGPRTYVERLEKFLVEYTLSHTHTLTHTHTHTHTHCPANVGV